MCPGPFDNFIHQYTKVIDQQTSVLINNLTNDLEQLITEEFAGEGETNLIRYCTAAKGVLRRRGGNRNKSPSRLMHLIWS
jgi:hypothetical protein